MEHWTVTFSDFRFTNAGVELTCRRRVHFRKPHLAYRTNWANKDQMLMTFTIISTVFLFYIVNIGITLCVIFAVVENTFGSKCGTTLLVLEHVSHKAAGKLNFRTGIWGKIELERAFCFSNGFFFWKWSTFELTALSYKRPGDTYLIPDVYIAHEVFVWKRVLPACYSLIHFILGHVVALSQCVYNLSLFLN